MRWPLSVLCTLLVLCQMGCAQSAVTQTDEALSLENLRGIETAPDKKGSRMALIPPGEFVMGLTLSKADEYCQIELATVPETGCAPARLADRFPAHTVTLTHSYWMDMYEVSNRQYAECVKAGVCREPVGAGDWNHYQTPEVANYPVEGVMFEDAGIFCDRWRGGRLPTEAEWEYAARGSDQRLWPWGTLRFEADGKRFMNYHWLGLGAAGNLPMPVDSYLLGTSPFGLYNMAGNVPEWVSDWYSPYSSENAVDPTGPAAGSERIQRGGSYSGDGIFGASAFNRLPLDPTEPVFSGGLRCARSEPGR